HKHFLLMDEGWQKGLRMYGVIVHAEIRGEKIWLHRDGLEDGITPELLEAGISKVFNDPDFFNDFEQNSLDEGGTGQFAVNLIQFSSSAREEIPFTLIDSVVASQTFAALIKPISQIRLGTDLAEAIDLATNSLSTNQYDGVASVAIDISTDGNPDSESAAGRAATNALNNGVDVINAIAVQPRPGFPAPDIDFLTNNIIGGTNASGRDAFVLEVGSFGDEFEKAVGEKIVGEISIKPPSKETPEPASMLGLALVGAFGAVSATKRNKK
ncbi:MAG: element excision factor XisI family protein, partial [Spirulinaceae cyanobacterium]